MIRNDPRNHEFLRNCGHVPLVFSSEITLMPTMFGILYRILFYSYPSKLTRTLSIHRYPTYRQQFFWSLAIVLKQQVIVLFIILLKNQSMFFLKRCFLYVGRDMAYAEDQEQVETTL